MLQALAAAPGRRRPPVRMMLANDELRVVLVTIHLSLRAAIEAVTFDAVLETIAHRAPRRGSAAGRGRASRWPGSTRTPAKAACSATKSTPHRAGDRAPRVAEGIDASGPFAPDTVFMRAARAATRASSTSWSR